MSRIIYNLSTAKGKARALILSVSLCVAVVFAATGDEEFEKGKLAYTEKNYVEAFHHLSNAAEAGHGDAQFWLGSMYQSDNYGLTADWAKMYDWFEKAAQNGNAQAAYQVATRHTGTMIWSDDDYSDSIPLLERAAEMGHSEAMILLTEIYARGQEHHEDKDKLVYWMERAANAGHSKGQYHFAKMHINGYGVERDMDKAGVWMLAAAKNGYRDAQYEFGIARFRGLLGQDENKQDAIEWIKAAARSEHAAAYGFLGMAYLLGDPVAKDTDAAYSLFVQAASLGDTDAPLKLAEVFAVGGFGNPDIQTALTWLRIAELNEHPDVEQARAALKRKFGYEPYQLHFAKQRADVCVRSDYKSRQCHTGEMSEEEKELLREVYDQLSESN